MITIAPPPTTVMAKLRRNLKHMREYHCYEYWGARTRFFVGDIGGWNEREQGFRSDRSLGFDVLFYSHTGEFDDNEYSSAGRRYLSHSVDLTVWKWAIILTVRGKQIGPDWDALPCPDCRVVGCDC